VNALVIDIWTTGTSKGLGLIGRVREKYPDVPVCLLGTKAQLTTFPDVPERWRNRFEHYYQLPKDGLPTRLRAGAAQVADSGLGLHPLAGDRKGTRAVSVSGNWRVTFKFVGKDADAVDYDDYH
jgi:hypothetical protein